MPNYPYKKVLLIDDEDVGILPYVNPATTTELGVVKVDGTSIVADADGTIRSTTGLSGTVGDSITPVYVANGTVYECSLSIPSTADFVRTANLIESFPLIKSYSNGTSWYQIFSNAFCIQGSRLSRTAVNPQVQLLKAYKNTNYTVVATFMALETYSTGNTSIPSSLYTHSKSVTTFNLGNATYNASSCPYIEWTAFGYVASVEV